MGNKVGEGSTIVLIIENLEWQTEELFWNKVGKPCRFVYLRSDKGTGMEEERLK